jgi:hypothetical protein
MFIVTLLSLIFNIIFFLLWQIFLFLTYRYIQDPDPHSFEKLDPDPHKVNANPKHCFISIALASHEQTWTWQKNTVPTVEGNYLSAEFVIHLNEADPLPPHLLHLQLDPLQLTTQLLRLVPSKYFHNYEVEDCLSRGKVKKFTWLWGGKVI